MRPVVFCSVAALACAGCGGDIGASSGGGGGEAPATSASSTGGAGGSSSSFVDAGSSHDAGGEGGGTPADGGPPIDAGEDAGPVAPCGCFEGPGTYCADAAWARALAEGCALPKAESQAGNLLSCHGDVWRANTTCEGACDGGGSAADACTDVGYQLPWQCGADKLCTAVNAESWHHQAGSVTEFAFDFSFAIDTKVRAMRGGVVVVARFDTQPGDPCYGGCDEAPDVCLAKCGDKANVLTVRHDDGTVAQYLHLNAAAPAIAAKVRVEQGEFLARSGNTGWSTGPHLHVMVMKKGCKAGTCQSIPMRFHAIGMPAKGAKYTSENCP